MKKKKTFQVRGPYKAITWTNLMIMFNPMPIFNPLCAE